MIDLKALPSNSGALVTQKLSTESGQQQNLDAARTKTFELRRCFQLLQAVAGEIVDRLLAILDVLDVVGKGAIALPPDAVVRKRDSAISWVRRSKSS